MGLVKQPVILIVEDDEGHATLIQMNLKDAGLNNPIISVDTGKAGLAFIEDFLNDRTSKSLLVLLDLNLPDIDGYEILKWLKTEDQSRKIPVIILTSTDDEREISRCYELGCNIFLKKPVDYANFVRAIKQLGLFLSVTEFPSVH